MVFKRQEIKYKLSYNEYKYDMEFTRDNIMSILIVKPSRTTEIISMLLENDLIEKVVPAKYKFKK